MLVEGWASFLSRKLGEIYIFVRLLTKVGSARHSFTVHTVSTHDLSAFFNSLARELLDCGVFMICLILLYSSKHTIVMTL